ncbi:hypothetical protein [Burkholderia cenocepacia]|uniref:DUF1281 family ferredoxin-like fold protein n=1 Tax=Burkholderia cenocepacia TaxID=95486 RepID=UPI0026544C3C|nr:hypothetical protein [Burkholderia cenocepacia]MDN7678024.1 hypothetical protein [Burkholderia cenocepacia]
MPNDCFNKLTIRMSQAGKDKRKDAKKLLSDFWQTYINNDPDCEPLLEFERIIPGLNEISYGGDAQIHNDSNDEHLVLTFYTAWRPQKDILSVLVVDNPYLHFELQYSESGIGFKGYLIGKDGRISEEYWRNFTDRDYERWDEGGWLFEKGEHHGIV